MIEQRDRDILRFMDLAVRRIGADAFIALDRENHRFTENELEVILRGLGVAAFRSVSPSWRSVLQQLANHARFVKNAES